MLPSSLETHNSQLSKSSAIWEAFCQIPYQSKYDVTSRLTKAGCAFGKLQDRVWRVHDVSLRTNIAVYRAVVTTTLLYGFGT